MQDVFERIFKLKEHKTNFRTELIAGLTTFAAMSYVLVVNPGILSAGGMPIEGLITVTALAAALLALAGILLTIVLFIKKVTGAILISVLVLTLVGAFIPVGDGYLTQHTDSFIGMPDSISTTFMAMDILYPIEHLAETWDLIFALLFVNMFDTIGTLIGVSRRANLLDAEGKLPKLGKAMNADAAASVIGAAIGTSPVTSYV